MSFDGSLGYIQIASNFRVVASLQQQVDDLPLPGYHLVQLLVHALHLPDVLGLPSVADNQVPVTAGFGSLTPSFCMHATNLHHRR